MKKTDRMMYGHKFIYVAELDCWRSSSGKTVLVFPPSPHKKAVNSWWVIIPEHREERQIKGRGAEKRAFVVAEVYTRQGD